MVASVSARQKTIHKLVGRLHSGHPVIGLPRGGYRRYGAFVGFGGDQPRKMGELYRAVVNLVDHRLYKKVVKLEGHDQKDRARIIIVRYVPDAV